MQINYAEAPVSSLSLAGLLSKITLTEADRKFVDSTVAKIADVLELGARSTPLKLYDDSRPNHLHLEVDRLGAILAEYPTAENVEALHNAILRELDSELTADPINQVLKLAWSKLVDGLKPVALGLIDKCESLLDSESSKVRASIIQADSVFGSGADIGTFDARLLATRESLAFERNRICRAGASLAWLVQQGYAADPFAIPTPAKAVAVQDPPLTRGRQKLPIELLAEE
jgi:hypothetical protein